MKMWMLAAVLAMAVTRTGWTADEGLAFGPARPAYEAQAPRLALSQDVTLAAWIKLDANCPEGAAIVDNAQEPFVQGAAAAGWRLEIGKDRRLRFRSGMKQPLESAEPLPADRWIHVAASYSDGRREARLFVDGKPAGTQPRSDYAAWLRSERPLRVGEGLAGRIREVAAWNRVLDDAQVKSLAGGAAGGATGGSPLVQWTFADDGKATSLQGGPACAMGQVRTIVPAAPTPAAPLTLWFSQPARQWTEALPVGNGRLGAMIYGDIGTERLALNEHTVWAGSPYDPANENAWPFIQQARELIFAGKNAEAQKLLGEKAMGTPMRQASYQPLGDLLLFCEGQQGAVSNYTRTLDLDTAISTTRYTVNDITFTREVFASAPDDCLVVHLTASKPATLVATLTTPHQPQQVKNEDGCLVITGTTGRGPGEVPGKVQFDGRLMAIGDGAVGFADGGLTVKNATSVTLLFSAGTNYKRYNDLSADPAARPRRALQAAAARSYDELKTRHIADYQKLFRRVALDLGPGRSDQPTDQRIKPFANRQDPALAALYFQFGRYLLISSSRPAEDGGSQPANLQGLWNDLMNPPWNSKYTININTEMNYWPAEPTNLSECTAPLFSMIQDISETGRHTAQAMYHADGWVCHHNTDLWRATAPIDGPQFGYWPTGGAWLCTHQWEHYQFTGDKQFLAQVYPIWKGASTFFLDSLVEEPTHHWLVTCPSLSPEHGGDVAGPTMDESILRDLFAQTAKASEILGVDPDFRAKVLAARGRLAPFQVGKYGQLQEWLQDIDREVDTHRHPSHLYGLFPSAQITPDQPELFKAAIKSLIGRTDGGTGWSKAWKINLWARALDGDHSYKMLSEALTLNTFPNLFDAHPPFQIDGNFGGTSGMTEMLLQSQNGRLDILPALPGAWPAGKVAGLVGRGGFVTDIQWNQGRPVRVAIVSRLGNPCTVSLAAKTLSVTCDGQAVATESAGAGRWTFATQPGKTYELLPR